MKTNNHYPRQAVLKFAHEMERQLVLHDDKGDWKDQNPSEQFGELVSQAQLLGAALKRGERNGKPASKELILKRCAHIANYAMIVADLAANSKGEKPDGK